MTTLTQLQVVDADAHVIETEWTWDYLEPSEQRFRPLLFSSPHDPATQYWVIEGQIRGFRFPTLSEQQLRELSQRAGRNMETPQAARELDDVELQPQGAVQPVAQPPTGPGRSVHLLYMGRVCNTAMPGQPSALPGVSDGKRDSRKKAGLRMHLKGR